MENHAITTDEYADRKTAAELTEKVTGQIMDQLHCESSFYMLFVDDGTSPTRIHQTYEDAEREAKRLAAKTMRPVYIFNAIEKITADYQFTKINLDL